MLRSRIVVPSAVALNINIMVSGMLWCCRCLQKTFRKLTSQTDDTSSGQSFQISLVVLACKKTGRSDATSLWFYHSLVHGMVIVLVLVGWHGLQILAERSFLSEVGDTRVPPYFTYINAPKEHDFCQFTGSFDERKRRWRFCNPTRPP